MHREFLSGRLDVSYGLYLDADSRNRDFLSPVKEPSSNDKVFMMVVEQFALRTYRK